jgi:hypothetical protein
MDALHWNLLGPPLWLIFVFMLFRTVLTILLKRSVLPLSKVFVTRASWCALATLLLFGISRIALLAIQHRKF